jgi:hypothetical protein
MPLALDLTIGGRVGAAVVRVDVDGVTVPIAADRTFTATVPATARLVAITTFDTSGRAAHRSLRVDATASLGAPA